MQFNKIVKGQLQVTIYKIYNTSLNINVPAYKFRLKHIQIYGIDI